MNSRLKKNTGSATGQQRNVVFARQSVRQDDTLPAKLPIANAQKNSGTGAL
jgi:hypothetical protein